MIEDDVMFGCDVCGQWTAVEPMCIDGHWHLCENCGDFEHEPTGGEDA